MVHIVAVGGVVRGVPCIAARGFPPNFFLAERLVVDAVEAHHVLEKEVDGLVLPCVDNVRSCYICRQTDRERERESTCAFVHASPAAACFFAFSSSYILSAALRGRKKRNQSPCLLVISDGVTMLLQAVKVVSLVHARLCLHPSPP